MVTTDARVDADAVLRSAVQDHQAGRLSEAEAGYRQVLAVEPRQPDALHLLGLVRAQSGDPDAAIELIARAVKLRPKASDFQNNLGEVLRATGKMQAAEKRFAAAVRADGANVTARLNWGAALLDLKRPQAAERQFQKVLDRDPASAHALFNLAQALKAQDRLDQAEAALQRLIKAHPSVAAAHQDLGALLHMQGRLAEARTSLEQAIALDDSVAGAHHNLGVVLSDSFAREESIACFRRALDLQPGLAMAHWHLGIAVFDQDDPKPAQACFAGAIQAWPELALAHCYHAMTSELLGNAAEAESGFARAVDLDPDLAATVESYRYARSEGAGARLFGLEQDILDLAAAEAPADGLVLEMGVFRGKSINRLARKLPDRTVYGFDAFQGLPEHWTDSAGKGSYDAGGALPDVEANVELHVGWFADTLAPFAAAHSGPIALLNVDCDLYSATRTVFDVLGDRLVAGSVIIFDEYFAYPGWREHEFKAFQELVAARGLAYDYLAFNVLGRQAVVRVR